MSALSVDRLNGSVPPVPPALTPNAGPQRVTQADRDLVDTDISERGFNQIERPKAEPGTENGEEEGFSFWDVLDVVNPLQHIPIVNTIYRELTGDQIGSVAKLAGGGLFFGPIGLGFAALDVGVKEMTGASLDEHVMAMINGEDAGNTNLAARDGTPPTALAAADSPDDGVGTATGNAGAPASAGPTAAGKPVAGGPLGLLESAPGQDGGQKAGQRAGQVQVNIPPALPAGGPLGLMTAVGIASPSPTAPATPAMLSAATPAPLSNNPPLAPSSRSRGRMAKPTDSGPDHLMRAMEAQGLKPAQLMAVPTPTATAVSAQMLAAQRAAPSPSPSSSSGTVENGTGGPVDVPAWFDSAMMKATEAYKKTGRVVNAAPPG